MSHVTRRCDLHQFGRCAQVDREVRSGHIASELESSNPRVKSKFVRWLSLELLEPKASLSKFGLV